MSPIIVPVNVNDYATQYTKMDEDLVYTGVVTFIALKGPDKNGNNYLSVDAEVTAPEAWAGKEVGTNYLGLPEAIRPDMDEKARRRAKDSGVRYRRFVEAAKLPKDDKGQVDVEKAIGKTVQFRIVNEDWNGQPRPKIADFLI